MAGPAPPPSSPPVLTGSAPVDDAISNSVAILGGQTIAVSTPKELAKAIGRIAERSQRSARSQRGQW